MEQIDKSRTSKDLAQAATQLHDEFDAVLGASIVDRHIEMTAARFTGARVQTFVPLLVHRFARENLMANAQAN